MPRNNARKDALCRRIEALLREHFPHDTVDASLSGIRRNIHVLAVSPQFDDLSETVKQEHLWDVLEKGGLKDHELARISLILPLSVRELVR